jgi:secretion/DNA translocation related TadE-like protein
VVTRLVGQRGSGTLLGLALIAGTIVMGSAGVVVTSALVEAKHLQEVTNQAALAASDVSRGITPDRPCEVARALVNQAGYRLEDCETRAGSARIVAGGSWWDMPLRKRALAEPVDHPVFRLRP